MTAARPEAPAGLALTLRQATADHHKRAEEAPFQRRFAAGRLDRDTYIRWAGQMHRLHERLEALSRDAVARDRSLGALLDPALDKAGHLARDLAFLGSDPAMHPALPALQAFLDRLAEAASGDPAPLVGVLYVLEGSTNGNRFLARNVRRGLGLEHAEGTSYLDPYGEAQPQRWRGFVTALDTALPAASEGVAVAWACETFDAVRAIGDAVLGDAASH